MNKMSGGSGREVVERKILSLLHGRKTRTQLPQIHAHILRHHLHQSNQILAHFVSVCGSLHQTPYARLIFHQVYNPNVLLFNSIIKASSLSQPFEYSLHFFTSMKRRGIYPDEFTFAPLLKSCANLVDLRMGRGVHAGVLRFGFERLRSIRIGIVELYASCGKMAEAYKVFDEMPHRDVIVWNLMVNGFCKVGDVGMGLCLFKQMSERSVVSWNSMISGLARSDRDSEALEVFREMQESGFKPDEGTVVSVLPACARLGEVDVGQWILSYARSGRLFKDFISVGNSLVDFFCKCGMLEKASTVFREMPRKNVVSWNVMISGLAFNGSGELGVDLFEEMMSEGVNPDGATFVGVLACCAHAGLVERGWDLFCSMSSKHHIEPTVEHYGSMADILGRSGRLSEARDLIHSMPMKPNAALWGALLSACRTHEDMELAEIAVNELIVLEPWNSGNYVLLSNIYAERGKWDEVEKMRVLMRGNCINKAPGQSMVG